MHDLCSNQFAGVGREIFTCPFETARCGKSPQVTLPLTGIEQSVQSKGFDTYDACYYWIEAMPGASDGGYIYVYFNVLNGVSPFVSIKKSIDSPDITCAITEGSVLILQNPYKLYLSFQALTQGAKFWFKSYYTPEVSDEEFHNASLCSDGGELVSHIKRPETEPTIPDGGGTTEQMVKLEVLSKEQRIGLISLAQQEELTAEKFVSAPAAVSDDTTTFKVLLLVVGVLLIIVAALLMANTWVTRKHLRMNINDRD